MSDTPDNSLDEGVGEENYAATLPSAATLPYSTAAKGEAIATNNRKESLIDRILHRRRSSSAVSRVH